MSYTNRLEFKDLGRTSLHLNLLVTSTSSLCFHLEFQRTRQGIHHLEPGFTGLGILYHAGTHVLLESCRKIQTRYNISITGMLTKHLLHLVTLSESDFLRIIEVDHIRVPVMIAILAEQRSIRSHFHDISVTFHITEMNTLCQSAV